MIKILFVCHGNICRSPMAEFIMKKLVKESGEEDRFYIASCATSTEEIYRGVGNPIYPPAKAALSRHGIEYSEEKRATQLTKKDYDNYDLIVVMDERNISNAKRIIGNDKEGKIHKLMDFTDRKGDVADPWYSGDFEKAFEDIYEGCECLLKKLTR